MYEYILTMQHIDPDILSEIGDKTLLDIGIPTGDIICLKRDCMVWWNGPDAKQKCSDTDQSLTSKSRSPTCPSQKKVAYEKKYHDGSSCQFTAFPMIPGNDNRPRDYDLWYQSTDHGVWLPVPKRFIVCEDAEKERNGFSNF